MGEKPKQAVAEEINQAKYFSIIVDSMPDLSHTDQLPFVFRFVSANGRVVERFIGFKPIHSHTGISLAISVIKMMRDLWYGLSNSRRSQKKKTHSSIMYTVCCLLFEPRGCQQH